MFPFQIFVSKQMKYERNRKKKKSKCKFISALQVVEKRRAEKRRETLRQKLVATAKTRLKSSVVTQPAALGAETSPASAAAAPAKKARR